MDDKEIKKTEELQNEEEQVLSDEELNQVAGGDISFNKGALWGKCGVRI